MPNYPTLPKAFFVIDETNWNEYAYIMPGDECFYLWERMSKLWRPGAVSDYQKYPANNLIANFQIPVSCRETNIWRYGHKIRAMKFAARALGSLLLPEWRDGTFVPVPPSKVRGDPNHDDRLLKTLKMVAPPLTDIRELVLLAENVDSKQKGVRPDQRSRDYVINEDEADPEPTEIYVFDDLLTTGCHFKAVSMILRDRFPNAIIRGIFLARAIRPPEDDEVDCDG